MTSGGNPENHYEQSSGQMQSALLYLLSFLLGIFLFLIFISQNDSSITIVAVIWGLGMGGLLLIEHFLGNTLSSYRFLRVALIVLFSSLFAYYLFGMNFEAKFWLIDDHEIMIFLGEDGKMALSEAPGMLIEETEVGKFGKFPRFRPSYYSARLFETWLWGNNPSLWYLSRVMMVTLIITIAWYVLAELIGFLPAVPVIAFVFTWPMWGDIFSRLGPAETYAALGLAFFFLGAFLILKDSAPNSDNARQYLGWLSVMAGTLLAVGAKENFLLLLPIVLILLAVALRHRRTPKSALLSTLVIFACAGLVAYAILSSLSKVGTDIHGQSTGLFYRLSLVWDIALTVPSVLFLTAIALLIVMLLWSYRAQDRKALRRPTWIALVIVSFCYLLLHIGQYIFYVGNWPTGNRYDFPGLLYKPVIFITLIWYTVVILQHIGVESSVEKGLRAGLLVGATLLVGALTYTSVREVGFLNARQTQNYARKLENVSTILRNDSDSALVIESHFVLDYETIISWGRFLQHANGIENPIFLRIHGYSSDSAETPLHENLAIQLEEALLKGERGMSPIHELEKFGDRCYSLQLSGHTDAGCQDVE
jgi:hypothetical protein